MRHAYTGILIVPLDDPAEFLKTEHVQRDAWGIDLSESIIPFHTLIAAQHHSGLVLAAYHKNGMIGCLFGFSAYDQKRNCPYHYSHITCVLRKYQNNGVGFQLKKAQRKHLLDRNIDLVKWTYDPLQAGNAYFNIRKLGAIAREYHRDLYGKMPDELNRGTISDRFEAEWWINSRHVTDALQGRTKHFEQSHLQEETSMINETRLLRGLRVPLKANLKLHKDQLLFEIPNDIGRVRKNNPRFARKWTLHTRKCFEHYFREGYTATDVLVDQEPSESRVYYLLEHATPPK